MIIQMNSLVYVPETVRRQVHLFRYFRVADAYFAADHTSFWGAKIG